MTFRWLSLLSTRYLIALFLFLSILHWFSERKTANGVKVWANGCCSKSFSTAVFHCFSDQDRQHFLDNLQYVIKPAGLYIQLCISEKETRINIGPRYIKKSDLTSLFSPANGWTIESIEDVIFISRSESPLGLESQAYLSLIRRHSSTLIEH